MNQKKFDYFETNPFQSIQHENLMQNVTRNHEVKMNSHIWKHTDPIVQSEQKITIQKPISVRNENSYKTTFCVTVQIHFKPQEQYGFEQKKSLRKQIENPNPHQGEEISNHRIRKDVHQISDKYKRDPILQGDMTSINKIYPDQQRPSYSKPVIKY